MHVDEARIQNALPIGQPSEWSDGMTTAVDVSVPPQLPDDYPIYTMDFSDFLKSSVKDLQDIFRRYPAIVVSGCPTSSAISKALRSGVELMSCALCMVMYFFNEVIFLY